MRRKTWNEDAAKDGRHNGKAGGSGMVHPCRYATAAIVLSSWDEAIAHCESFEWKDLRLEAANQLCERLMERSRERFEKWNDVVHEMKKTLSFVRGKIERVVREHNPPKAFEDAVQV